MEHWLARSELLLGSVNLERLARTKVAVVGLGGVGGHAVEALARSGVGSLVLIDFDVVTISNLNRQIGALRSTLGQPKTATLAERVLQINPDCVLRVHQEYYEAQAHTRLLPPDLDYVVDAIDHIRAKVDLIESCLSAGTPLISALGAGNRLDPTKLTLADISETHTCPLARSVRLELRKRGIFKGVPVVFSAEPMVTASRGRLVGSSAFVPAAAGLIMASWVVRQVCGSD